ncbi:hypothetical protein [Leptolyngbya ohadii]|uniref:hypothetical protein n=1 Tax=Leptolyngbya ohadii TaxID=1962290 RepID=UPI000B59B4ED|nr:hypothetical protein [Leptolyngbya ohadii]
MDITLETAVQKSNAPGQLLERIDSHTPKPEQLFRETLKETLEAAGIGSEQPVRIQFGREVIFKGIIDNPTVNKLNRPSVLGVLNTVLDLISEGESPNEAPGSQRGVLNIDVGDRRVVRMEGGQVKINELAAVRIEQRAQENLELIEAVDTVTEAVLEESGSDLKQIVKDIPEGFDAYREVWQTVNRWVREAVPTNSDLQAFAQQFPSQVEAIAGRLMERQFAPVEAALPLTQREPFATSGLSIQTQFFELTASAHSLWSNRQAKHELRQFDQKLNPQPQKNPIQSIAASAATVADGWTDKLKVPAAAIALKELYRSNLSPTAQEWAKTALEPLHKAAGLVPENLPERTLDLTSKAISQISAIPGELRKRQLADTVVKLTKTLGTVQDAGKFVPDAPEGRKVFGVDTGNFRIHVRNTHQYIVNNAMGEEIMRFSQTPLGPKFSCCQPNALEQRDFLQARKHLTPDLAKYSAETIAAKLGNLTPIAKQAEARDQQTQQLVDRINRRLDRSVAEGNFAVEKNGYRLQQHDDGSRTLTSKGMQQPRLIIGANGKVKSSLQPEDFARLGALPEPQKTAHKTRRDKGAER